MGRCSRGGEEEEEMVCGRRKAWHPHPDEEEEGRVSVEKEGEEEGLVCGEEKRATLGGRKRKGQCAGRREWCPREEEGGERRRWHHEDGLGRASQRGRRERGKDGVPGRKRAGQRDGGGRRRGGRRKSRGGGRGKGVPGRKKRKRGRCPRKKAGGRGVPGWKGMSRGEGGKTPGGAWRFVAGGKWACPPNRGWAAAPCRHCDDRDTYRETRPLASLLPFRRRTRPCHVPQITTVIGSPWHRQRGDEGQRRDDRTYSAGGPVTLARPFRRRPNPPPVTCPRARQPMALPDPGGASAREGPRPAR